MKLQITIDGRVYAVDVELLEEEPTPPDSVYLPAVQPESPASVDVKLDLNLCRSPVNGLVFKVHVAPGQSVEAGAPVLVLEAMKMETNIAAPRAARVKAVHVKPGDPVKVNQVLVEFE